MKSRNEQWASFRTNTLIGLLLLAPLVVSIWLLNGMFRFVTNVIVPFLPEDYRQGIMGFLARVAALLVIVGMLYFIGRFVRNFFGRSLYEAGDRFLSRVPGLRGIYKFVRQIIEVFFANRDTSFKEVVLIEYPRLGVYSIGFVTAVVPERHTSPLPPDGNGTKGEWLSIFIPTTPNPTGGWYVIVRRSDAIRLEMTPGEAMKLILSGGAVFPGEAAGEEDLTLLDRVEHIATKSDSATKRDG